MRTRTLSAIASVAILAAASSANAAAIDIVVSQIPGTTDWALQLSFSAFLKVGSLSVETSPNLTSFTINPAIPEISPFGDLSVFALGLLPDGNGVLMRTRTGNRRSSSFFAAVDRRTIEPSDVLFVFSP